MGPTQLSNGSLILFLFFASQLGDSTSASLNMTEQTLKSPQGCGHFHNSCVDCILASCYFLVEQPHTFCLMLWDDSNASKEKTVISPDSGTDWCSWATLSSTTMNPITTPTGSFNYVFFGRVVVIFLLISMLLFQCVWCFCLDQS